MGFMSLAEMSCVLYYMYTVTGTAVPATLQITRKLRKVYIPLRVTCRNYDTLAHKMFLRTPEATTHVYIHRWGPKGTCHDTLEPIRNIGRVPTWAREAPGGRSSRMKF